MLCMERAAALSPSGSPALLLTSSVNLGKSLNFPEAHCPHLRMEIIIPTSQDCFKNCFNRPCYNVWHDLIDK